MKKKINFKVISYFLVLLLASQSFNAIASNKNIVYGDTLNNGQAVSAEVKDKAESEEAVELEKSQVATDEPLELKEGEGDIEDNKKEADDKTQNYLEEDGNIYISPEEVVAREETENTLNSLELVNEPEDTYIYEPINSFETFANVSYPEDVNGDGIINKKDLDIVSSKYNLKSGDSGYTAKYDINGDGIIDLFDFTLISSKFGTACGKLIAIDPGHGGTDPGATGPSGLKEKTVVLNVGLMVRDMLIEKGYRVIMTRTGDYRLSENLAEDLKKRAEVANNANADFFVSIHANSFTSSTAHGTETYYHKNLSSASPAAKLASSIQTELINTLGRYNRKVKTADFSVLRNTNMDAALTEIAFISNPEEEKLLGSAEFQKNAAKAIVAGIIGGIN